MTTTPESSMNDDPNATTDLATPEPRGPSPAVLETVLLGGDISRLTPIQRLSYYTAVCRSVGLNPLTRPFDFLRLSGKEVLYAKKDAAEQLRRKHHVSLGTPRADLVDGLYLVWIAASLPDGRTDADVGVVDLGGLKGDARANAMMKALTKAKRRVTLSICGLGLLDETEVETIADAQPLDFDPTTGELHERPSATPAGKTITPKQRTRLFTIARQHGWTDAELRAHLRQKFSVHRTSDLLVTLYDKVIADVSRGPRREPPAAATDEMVV